MESYKEVNSMFFALEGSQEHDIILKQQCYVHGKAHVYVCVASSSS